MLSLLLAATLSFQEPVEDTSVLDCITISRGKTRLRCYDEALHRDELLAAAENEAATMTAEAEAAELLAAEQARVAALEAELAAAQERADEAELRASRSDALAKEATKGFETFTAEVLETSFSRYGRLTVKLSNGETWRQLESDSTTIRPQRADRIQTVEIRAAAMGSRRMRIDPLGKTIRVRRVDDE